MILKLFLLLYVGEARGYTTSKFKSIRIIYEPLISHKAEFFIRTNFAE